METPFWVFSTNYFMVSITMFKMLRQAKLNFWRPLHVQFSVDTSQPGETEGSATAVFASPASGQVLWLLFFSLSALVQEDSASQLLSKHFHNDTSIKCNQHLRSLVLQTHWKPPQEGKTLRPISFSSFKPPTLTLLCTRKEHVTLKSPQDSYSKGWFTAQSWNRGYRA